MVYTERRSYERILINEPAIIEFRNSQFEGIILNQSNVGACLRSMILLSTVDEIEPLGVVRFSWSGSFPDNSGFVVSCRLEGELIWINKEKMTLGVRILRRQPDESPGDTFTSHI